uniref:Uncharacterized protein n=1 Tax=Arundo donax TaxID=35708 RepID=A0A0A8ZNG7_ARUDO
MVLIYYSINSQIYINIGTEKYKCTKQLHRLSGTTTASHNVPRSVSVWRVCGPHPSGLCRPLWRVYLLVIVIVLPCGTPQNVYAELLTRPCKYHAEGSSDENGDNCSMCSDGAKA